MAVSHDRSQSPVRELLGALHAYVNTGHILSVVLLVVGDIKGNS